MQATQADQINAQTERMRDLLRLEYAENLREDEGTNDFTVSRPGGPNLHCFLEDPFSDTSTGIDLRIKVTVVWEHGEVPPLSSESSSKFDDFVERSVEPFEALDWDDSDSVVFETSPLLISRDYILMDATPEQVVERIRLLVDHGSSFTFDDPDTINEDHLAQRYGAQPGAHAGLARDGAQRGALVAQPSVPRRGRVEVLQAGVGGGVTALRGVSD